MGMFVVTVVIVLVVLLIAVIALAIYVQSKGPAAVLAEQAELVGERAEKQRAREQGLICTNWRPAHEHCQYRPLAQVNGLMWRPVGFLAHNGIEALVILLLVGGVAWLVSRAFG